jgi:hypothetical protein
MGSEDRQLHRIFIRRGVPWRVAGRRNLGWHCWAQTVLAKSRIRSKAADFQRSILYLNITVL